jgi:hypothetical protein
MVLNNAIIFFQINVWLEYKKLYFEYHDLLNIMVILEYLKLHSNQKNS